jgi:hypothetical protein
VNVLVVLDINLTSRNIKLKEKEPVEIRDRRVEPPNINAKSTVQQQHVNLPSIMHKMPQIECCRGTKSCGPPPTEIALAPFAPS